MRSGIMGNGIIPVPSIPQPNAILGSQLYAWSRYDAWTITGGKVETAIDKTGNGNDATQAVAAQRPVYFSAGGPSGRPYAQNVAADNDGLVSPTAVGGPGIGDYTGMFAVVAASSSNTGMIMQGDPGESRMHWDTGPDTISFRFANGAGYDLVYAYGTAWHKLFMYQTAAPTQRVWIDGVMLLDSGFTIGLTNAITGLTLGNGVFNAMDALWSEMGFINGLITNAQATAMLSYLALWYP